MIEGSAPSGTASSLENPRRRAIQAFIAISAAPIRSPGTMPPRNRYPIEVFETSA